MIHQIWKYSIGGLTSKTMSKDNLTALNTEHTEDNETADPN